MTTQTTTFNWPLFAFDNYFEGADREYPANERWDLLKQLGYEKAYLSINRAQDASWQHLEGAPAQMARTGLGLAAAYTVIDLTDPAPVPGRSPEEMLALLPDGTVFEIAMSVGWKKDCSDPGHDAAGIELLNTLLPLAKARGITLSLYHHFGFWQERIEDCVRLAAAVNDPSLGVTFCGYHWYAIDATDLAGKLRLAAPWLKLANLCGSRTPERGMECPLPKTIEPVGSGDFPLADFITQLRKIGYGGDVGFQGYSIGGHPPDTLRQSIEAFRVAESAG